MPITRLGSIRNTLDSMKRRWNILIWGGFAFVIAALVSYIPVFALFPVTRDVPWVNYLLFFLGGFLLAVGIMRAFRDPEHYRGKISGSILAGFQIVGIAADTRYADLRTDSPPTFYAPYVQKVNGPSRMMVELRTIADPASVLTGARTAIESLDPDLPMIDVRTMKEQVRSTLADERALAQLAGGFSLLALVLASIGIYGMMAYAVNTRTGEIGLRIALGARASQVLSRVLREAFWVTGAGIVLGLIAALWLTRFIRVMLYGLAGTDALTVGGTAALLIAVSLLAAFAPARRASRIDPIRALRHD